MPQQRIEQRLTGEVAAHRIRTVSDEAVKLFSIDRWHHYQHHAYLPQADKLPEKMRHNPRDWQIADFEVLAVQFGFKVRKNGGNHAVFFS